MARVLEESAEHARIDITMSQILNCLSDQQTVKCGFVPSNQILRLKSGEMLTCANRWIAARFVSSGLFWLWKEWQERQGRENSVDLLTGEQVDSANRQELFGLFIKKPGQVVPPKAWTVHAAMPAMHLALVKLLTLVTDFEGTAWCGASTTKDATTTTFVVRVPKAFFLL